MNKEKLWTKEFLIVSAINFLLTLMFFLLIVTMASYATTEYGASTSTAGLVSSIFIIGSLIGRLGAGRVIGDLGTKKTLWIGLTFFLVTSVLYFFTFNLGLLMTNRLLQGIAVGIASTATGTIIAQIVPGARKGEGIGYYSLSAILATAIGPSIGIMMINLENGYTLIFIQNVVLSVICMIIYAIAKFEILPMKAVGLEEHKGSLFTRFIEPKAIPISLIALLVGFSYSGVMSFLSFYAEEINLTSTASYFFIVLAIVIILSRPFTGKLLDVRGANIVAYPCLLIFAVGMYLFSQASAGWMLLLAAAFIGLGYGNFNSIAQTVAVKVTPPHRFGLATSTYFILYDLGLGVGPYILGFIVPHTGYSTVFLGIVFVILVSIPLYLLLHGRRDKELLNIPR